MTSGVKALVCTACEQPFTQDNPRHKAMPKHIDCARAFWRECDIKRRANGKKRCDGNPQRRIKCASCGQSFLTRSLDRMTCIPCDLSERHAQLTPIQETCIARKARCGPDCPVMMGVESIPHWRCRVKTTREVQEALCGRASETSADPGINWSASAEVRPSGSDAGGPLWDGP